MQDLGDSQRWLLDLMVDVDVYVGSWISQVIITIILVSVIIQYFSIDRFICTDLSEVNGCNSFLIVVFVIFCYVQ